MSKSVKVFSVKLGSVALFGDTSEQIRESFLHEVYSVL